MRDSHEMLAYMANKAHVPKAICSCLACGTSALHSQANFAYLSEAAATQADTDMTFC